MRVRQVPAAIPTLYSLLSILHDPGHKGRGGRHPGGWLGGVVWQGLGWVVIRQTYSWTLRDCGAHLHQTVHSGSLSHLGAILSLSSILLLTGPSLYVLQVCHTPSCGGSVPSHSQMPHSERLYLYFLPGSPSESLFKPCLCVRLF